jgi:CheY-like chemotaxis protein
MPKMALVVDDSMLMRFTVCRFLEERGLTVECATNGAEAMETVGRVHPDIIVTDMRMPTMSGSELITALKSKPETAKVPILIVASRVDGLDERETRADFVIYKDVEIETQLEKALTAVIGRKRRGRAAGK